MKKTICIISLVILIISALCACNKADTKQTAKKATTTSTTASTTEFTVGSEVATSAYKNENEKQIYHKDGEGNDLLLEKYNSDGKIESYEEPVYSNDGSVDRIKYYDANKKLVASSGNDNRFYNKDGKEISENEFIVIMKEANIIK